MKRNDGWGGGGPSDTSERLLVDLLLPVFPCRAWTTMADKFSLREKSKLYPDEGIPTQTHTGVIVTSQPVQWAWHGIMRNDDEE